MSNFLRRAQMTKVIDGEAFVTCQLKAFSKKSCCFAIMNHEPPQRLLILIAGLPGSGKTTIAEALAAKVGGLHINSDNMRIQMELQGHYAALDKQIVYQAMADAVSTGLCSMPPRPVIADSTFVKADLRKSFETLARQADCPFFWVWVWASPEETEKRMKQKRQYSEADFSVYLKLKEVLDHPAGRYLHIRTDQLDVDACVRWILRYIHTSLQILQP